MKQSVFRSGVSALALCVLAASGAAVARDADFGSNAGLLLAQADTNRGAATSTSGNTTNAKSGAVAGRVDVTRVAAGMRADKILGAQVYNSADESIGTIDDLIVEPGDRVVYAIVSVGGFLGIGERLVAVPFDRFSFQKRDDDMRMVLADSTKTQLEAMPEFRYAR